MAATSKWPAMAAHTLLQPILNVARLVAKTCTQRNMNTEGASEKGKIRLDCAAPLHLMRNKG